jgi:Ser/Thr protein kinase RdoA (MazF antagonist)
MKNILKKYEQLKDCNKPEPFGDGHINDTFLVKSPQGSFILQRVNPNVFHTPTLVRNLDVLFNALRQYEKNTGQKLTPALFKNKEDRYHTLDEEGAAWRLMEFFPGCQTYTLSPGTDISYRAARAMGAFQLFLNTLPAQAFGETIPNFHNTHGRLETFRETLKSAPAHLKEEAKEEIAFCLDNQNIASEIKALLDSGEIPVRVTHNDTKLENILFTSDGQALIIDLDTIMPGTVLFDYGDMVRSFTSPAKEDEPDLSKVTFRTDHFEALTRGYLEPLKDVLTQTEKSHLLLGAKAIIYEQTLRFLNDFLQGDVYYKTAYPGHNLVRTRTQIKLLQEILEKGNTCEAIMKRLDKNKR